MDSVDKPKLMTDSLTEMPFCLL